jgi:carbohydrate kinase (thermoresistant glucokinase family)
MGVASCGKTSVGEAVCARLGAEFAEGDRLHPVSNVAKMSAGIPLTDEDRWPWLGLVGQSLQGRTGRITSCSALKRAYRDYITARAGRPVAFVFMDGSRELLEQRIATPLIRRMATAKPMRGSGARNRNAGRSFGCARSTRSSSCSFAVPSLKAR